jgi:hypothetical protein
MGIRALPTEMLRVFGLERVQDLPEYEQFHTDGRIEALLSRLFAPERTEV